MSDTAWIMRVNWRIPRDIAESGREPFASPAWRRLTEIHTKRSSDLKATRDIRAFLALHNDEQTLMEEAVRDVLRWPMIQEMHQTGLLISTKIVPPNISHNGVGAHHHIVRLALLAGGRRSTARKTGELFGKRADELGIRWYVYEHRMGGDEDPSTFEEVEKHSPTGWVLTNLEKGWELDTDILMIYADADDFSDEIRREGGL